jgi:hypothetical protein
MKNIYRALKEMYSDGTEYTVVARTVFLWHGFYFDVTECILMARNKT